MPKPEQPDRVVLSALVVDDIAVVRSVTCERLEHLGVERAETASSCSDLKRVLRTFRPTFILLDLYLGSCLGTSMVPHILRVSPDSKIYIMSGEPEPEVASGHTVPGIDGWIRKDVNLPQKIERIVEECRSRSAVPTGTILQLKTGIDDPLRGIVYALASEANVLDSEDNRLLSALIRTLPYFGDKEARYRAAKLLDISDASVGKSFNQHDLLPFATLQRRLTIGRRVIHAWRNPHSDAKSLTRNTCRLTNATMERIVKKATGISARDIPELSDPSLVKFAEDLHMRIIPSKIDGVEDVVDRADRVFTIYILARPATDLDAS